MVDHIPSRRRGPADAGPRMPGRLIPGFAQLESKLEPPAMAPWLVRRDGMLRQLAAVDPDVALVLLVAAPGYGRTTTLAQWAAEQGDDVAWVTVDEDDDDPTRLIGHIALALHRIRALDAAVWPAFMDGTSVTDVVLPRLVASLAERPEPILLILDDVDTLRHWPSRRLIRSLAASLPASSHLVVSSRHRDSLHVGRLRTEHRCVEFGAPNLAFDVAEARSAFEAVGFDCSNDVLTALVRRTEGWPAGLHLAALGLRGRPDAAAAAAAWGGDDTFVVDYFRDVVLDQEPDGLVQFLIQTAPLEQMSGALCDAVLGTTGSARMLLDLANRNRFVVPLDRHGEWYRHHRLFAEALRVELSRRDPGHDVRLLGWASGWSADRSSAQSGISSAGADSMVNAVSRLISAHGGPLNSPDWLEPVPGWLQALSEEIMLGDPRLATLAACAWAYSGAAVRALRGVEAARRRQPGAPSTVGTVSVEAAVTVINAALAPLGVERMLVDARRAVDLEPPDAPWHPQAAVLLGVALLLNDAPAAAAEELAHAALLGREHHPAVTATALAELALLAAGRDDWAAAEAYAADSGAVVRGGPLRNFLPNVLASTALARVTATRGDEEDARRHASDALRLSTEPSSALFPWVATQVAIALGYTFLDLSEFAAARSRADEARRHLARLLTEGVLRAQLERLTSAIDQAAVVSTRDAVEPVKLTLAERRVLELLPTHLALAEIGDELHISRNTVKTHVAVIYRKFGVASRTQAVRRARNTGLL